MVNDDYLNGAHVSNIPIGASLFTPTGYAQNSVDTLYTMGAGEQGYLTGVELSGVFGSESRVWVATYDGGGTLRRYARMTTSVVGIRLSQYSALFPPIIILPNYSLRLGSSAAGTIGWAMAQIYVIQL